MKIIYWSDFNCPYSYIGYTRLKKAMNELKLDIELDMKAFELEHELDDEIIPMVNHYARKYGIPEFQAKDMLKEKSVSYVSEKLGFTIIYAFSRAYKNFYGYSPKNTK